MWVYDPGRTCRHCNISDTLFFTQKQRQGQLAISTTCFKCQKYLWSVRYYKYEKLRRYNMEKI